MCLDMPIIYFKLEKIEVDISLTYVFDVLVFYYYLFWPIIYLRNWCLAYDYYNKMKKIFI